MHSFIQMRSCMCKLQRVHWLDIQTRLHFRPQSVLIIKQYKYLSIRKVRPLEIAFVDLRASKTNIVTRLRSYVIWFANGHVDAILSKELILSEKKIHNNPHISCALPKYDLHPFHMPIFIPFPMTKAAHGRVILNKEC